jgi:hypothetical protein
MKTPEFGFYLELVAHPKVITVLALLDSLSAKQSNSEFDAVLDGSIASIFEASTKKNIT